MNRKFIKYLTSLLFAYSLVLVGITSLSAEEKQPDLQPGKLSGKALVAELQKGGHIIYLRHGMTDKSQADSQGSDFSNCAAQRNLSEEGRKQASSIGEAIKTLDIPVGDVISSPYCRCLETGKLAFGKATASENLVFLVGTPPEIRSVKTAELKKILGTQPADHSNTVIISHTANLKEAASLWPDPEGVAAVFLPKGDGTFEYLGRMLPEDWNDTEKRM